MVQARFAGFTFEIAETATLFDDLKFSGECAVEENTSGTAQYVSRKNGKAGQVSFTAILNAALGADVRKAALEFEAAARYGQTGTLVVGEEALLPYEMMLTKAEISEIVISPAGKWVSAKAALTLRQAGTDGKESYGEDGGSGGGAGGGAGGLNVGEALVRGGTEAAKWAIGWAGSKKDGVVSSGTGNATANDVAAAAAAKGLDVGASIAAARKTRDTAKKAGTVIPKNVSDPKYKVAISAGKK